MKNILFALSIVSILLVSCSKEEGEGGRASIKGQVYAKDYNESFSQL